MYMLVRKYRMKSGASLEEIVQRVQEGFVPLISQTPGFVAYQIIDSGSAAVTPVTLFQDKAGADESTRRASDWVSDNLISLLQLPADIMAGEMIFSQTS